MRFSLRITAGVAIRIDTPRAIIKSAIIFCNMPKSPRLRDSKICHMAQ